jgi:acyl carrier protein
MSDPNVKEIVRQFVMESAMTKGVKEVGDNDSLTDNGIIDSLGIFRLVSYLEETLGVHIGDHEITQDNFSTVTEIEKFVNTKLAEQKMAEKN